MKGEESMLQQRSKRKQRNRKTTVGLVLTLSIVMLAACNTNCGD
ncbi:hypothetical protein PAECIP111893_00717 [Paenibacillus plantiphilus]|uniref:Uncharacterized protein n=1 Tax=Paenibacillus plantiphilus TaxID=2905650 RepID=A0ABN8G807_9BACL|nr:hypothetical protein PAECIP111893_00717 [Paenibacillus plantiphilus]